MHPTICTLGPFTIYSYGLMLAIAFMVSSWLAATYASQKGIPYDKVYNLTFVSFVCGIIGARIFYILQHLSYYREFPREIIMLSHGGLSWYGGLIAGTLAAFTYIKRKRLPLYGALDIVVPFIALGQAIGRLGCLLNGCCFGRESPWGFYFPSHGETLFPVQLISSLALLAIFVVLRLIQERDHPPGAIFFSYLLLYSVKRFFMEYLRADAIMLPGGLSLFQALSVILFIVAAAGLSALKKNRK